jgi:nucleoside phosphorylase
MKRAGIMVETKSEIPRFLGKGVLQEGIRRYAVEEKEVGLKVSGIGHSRVQQNTASLIAQFSPDYVVFLGYCGAVNDTYSIGDLVIADEVSYKAKPPLSTSKILLPEAERILQAHDIAWHIGRMKTFDDVVLSRNSIVEKVDAVDMESYFVANECLEKSVPVLIVKAVSDIVSEKSPPLNDILKKMRKLYVLARLLWGMRKGRKPLESFCERYLSVQ